MKQHWVLTVSTMLVWWYLPPHEGSKIC